MNFPGGAKFIAFKHSGGFETDIGKYGKFPYGPPRFQAYFSYIQLRCRAVSATVLIRMLAVRCSFSWFSSLGLTLVSKTVPKIRKHVPKQVKRPPNGIKNVKLDPQNGYKMTKMARSNSNRKTNFICLQRRCS